MKEKIDRALILAARHELRIRAARQSLSNFVLETTPGYQMGWVHREICEELDGFLQDIADKKSPRLIICMPPRSGKLCADSTPVLTTKGWRTHGELKVGDEVFSPSGKPVRVIAIGPKNIASHEVEVSTGERFAVHLDHEWTIYSRPQAKYKTVETRCLIEPSPRTGKPISLTTGLMGKRGGRYLYQIDRVNPLQFEEVQHILPPYCLGVWLGDGTSSSPRINMTPLDAMVVKDAFEKLGVPITGEWEHSTTGVVTFSFASGVPRRRNKFSADMKRLRLFDGKYVPDEYKFDSESNLRELIAGLMDTDGTFVNGRYVFSTVSEKLALDVAEVIRLIGETAHIRKIDPTTSTSGIVGKRSVYTVSFFPTKSIPCRLMRKKTTRVRKEKRHAIVAVKQLESPKIGNCIQVDSEDGLYVIGKTFVATHNSEIVSRSFPAYAFGLYPDLQIIATSYSADLTQRFSRDVQRKIDDPKYAEIFPETSLNSKNVKTSFGSFIRTAELFEIVGHKGAYRAAGVGGGITGMGADCLVIDDAIKDRRDANSATIREALWDWYTSTAYTRLSPGGGVIVMCTRWHPIKDDTPVLTLAGWKRHGDLQVGDRVFGMDGRPVEVTHVCEPVWCDVAVETRTETVICGSKHLWPVKSRPTHNYVLKEAGNLLDDRQRTLPRPDPLDFGENEPLPIDPYWFGLWLGDGSKSGPDIRCGHAYTAHCESTPYSFTRYTDKVGNYCYRYRHQGLRGKLVKLGVLFNKHIPRCYLHASIEDRLALLAGLIDSDGDKTNNIQRFANSDERLYSDVKDLVSSLGMLCNNREVVNRKGTIAKDGYERNYDCNRFSFSPTVDIPCKVEYKRCKAIRAKERQVHFRKASSKEAGWGRCITTSAVDGIYLVGKSLMPTHNCDDLVGRLLDRAASGEGEQWRVINYPAIAEHDEPHRKAGEALHPERYDLNALLRIQKQVGSRDWAALYQQHPVPDGGGLFKDDWIQHWDSATLPKTFDAMCISWDMTFKGSERSDYVVGQVWGRKGANFYLLDQFRGQWDFVKTVEQFVACAEKWPRVLRKLVEEKANGAAVIATLKKHVSGLIPINPKESKEARAAAITPLWEAKNVFLPPSGLYPWVAKDFIPELLSFPAGAHDDQIDSMSQALSEMSRGCVRRTHPNNLIALGLR